MKLARRITLALLPVLAGLCLPVCAAAQTVTAVRIAGDTQRTDTTCAMTSGSAALTCSGGLFTAADANYGMPVRVVGAGASGADLITTIGSYTSSNVVTLTTAAATTVSAATAVWGVTHNGWVAELDISGLATGGTYTTGLTTTNDPTAAKVVFTVSSPGYTATAASTTMTRTVYCVSPMRKPYPNYLVNEEYSNGGTVTAKCVLSDYVYASDTATVVVGSGFYTSAGTANTAGSLTVANNSTVTYPDVIARWAWPGYETFTGSTYLLEAVAFHHFPQTGKPVAAVVFSCTDTSANTASVTVTAPTISTRGGDANPVLVYAANMPTSSFAAGSVVTCNFKAYPWVGNVASVADSSGASGWNTNTTVGMEKLGPQIYLKDTAAAYQAHAIVDSTNGSDASCGAKVYATQTAANTAYAASTANSFASWGKAFTCAKAYGTRTNQNDGIYLWVNGTIAMPGANVPTSDSGAADTWTQIAPAAGYTCTIGSGTNAYYYVRLLKVMGCAITGSSTGQFRGDGTTASKIWLDQTTINQSGAAPVWAYGMIYATRNTITAMGTHQFQHYSTSRAPTFLRSNVGLGTTVAADYYTALGNKQFYGTLLGADAIPSGQNIADNAVIAYNSLLAFISTSSDAMTGPTSGATLTTLTTGNAIVQNLYEKTGATSPEMFLYSDQVAATGTNLILWLNTFVGERSNMMYNDGGTTYYGCNAGGAWTQASIIGNLFSNENVKADTFSATSYGCSPGQSGLRTNNWGVRMGPGRVANVPITRSTNSTCDSAANYQGTLGVANGNYFGPEFGGLYSPSTVVVPKYANDASCGGDSGTGNGNYHLTGSPVAGAGIPAAYIPLPFDLNGSPRVNTGAGSIGAFEYQKSMRRQGGGWW
ncbi:MAG: hypothetical protein P4M01_14460 [Acidobacteriota bacterium]|nr:hypothetical protein [Acidobacteriota bacterium]